MEKTTYLIMETKHCKHCGKSENEVKFQEGRHECNPCRNKNKRELRFTNPEKYNEQLKKNLEWKKTNKNKMTKLNRVSHYQDRYGITIDDYNKMLKEQNGKCKICYRSDTGRKSSKYFVVDHFHSTGTIRGLLCHKCNVGLGKFEDNVNILSKAITYLKEAKCKI